MAEILEHPIILFCSERSGSNMIAKMFDAHPEISAPGAAHLFRVMHEVTTHCEPSSQSLRQDILRLFRAKVSHWAIDATEDARLLELLQPYSHAMEMSAALYQAECEHQQKKSILIKENSAYAYWQAIVARAAKARILYMVRDPRDMAVSWINGPVMRGGVVRAAKRWLADQTGYLHVLDKMESNIAHSKLRYEDILRDAKLELLRACKELSLEFSPDMLTFSSNSWSAQEDAARSAMWSNLNKPLLQNNTQKFLQELHDDQIAYIEALCGALMERLGYKKYRDADAPPYGQFASLDTLEAHLLAQEPMEKAAYYALPAQERHRFEHWSATYHALTEPTRAQ